MPLARQVVQDLAVEHGACIRPIQLRRTNLDTGETGHVLVPCGHTLAHVCPSCAERARTLRAAQCREGWHLEDEPDLTPDPATDDQQWWVITARPRPSSSATRPPSTARTPPTSTRSSAELDEEITKSGRPREGPPRPPGRRHRSTRRRQDTPDLPKRKVSPRTVGKTYTAPDGKTFRPSMFVTLTCPSYGRVDHRGVPVDPAAYDYDQAARDALTFAALFDRFIQNLRRYLGHDVQYFAAVEPQRRLAPHIHIAIRGTIARSELRRVLAATYHQVWWPDTGRQIRRRRRAARLGRARSAGISTRPPGKSSRPGIRRWMGSGPYDLPWHVARFGDRFDAQGVLAGSKDAARCIGYLTNTSPSTSAAATRPHRRRSRITRPGWPRRCGTSRAHRLRELAPVRHPAQERPPRPASRRVQGQSPRR